jgi:hypothetical protein
VAGVSKIDSAELMNQSQGRGVAASQATTIEQSRAVAQVQAALTVAHQRPRDRLLARRLAAEACNNPYLADAAFYRYKRGGSAVTGSTIKLAIELAVCWGNIEYGLVELARSEEERSSEMMAYAWDLEANIRVTNSFIAPHRRDLTDGGKDLTSLRDIYENNANLGARRLRECIFRVMPESFREEAEALCRATIESGGGKAIEAQLEEMLTAYGSINITRRQLEKKVGAAADRFSRHDLADLRIIFRSLKTGETRREDEFPEDAGNEAQAAIDAAKAKGKPAIEDKTKATEVTVDLVLPGKEPERLTVPAAEKKLKAEAFKQSTNPDVYAVWLEQALDANEGWIAGTTIWDVLAGNEQQEDGQ